MTNDELRAIKARVCGILCAQPIFEPASREEAQKLMRCNMAEADRTVQP